MSIEKKLKEWNKILIKSGDYRDLKLNNVNHCLDFSKYLMNSFFPSGKILKYEKRSLDGFENYLLFPKQLSHMDKDNWWLVHYVLSDSKNIYCPILGEISKIEDYSLKVFGENVLYEEYLESI